MTKPKPCKHGRYWLSMFGGVGFLWCYECGAIRKCVRGDSGGVYPSGGWVRPVGNGGENPAMKGKKLGE